MTAFTLTETLSRVITSCGGTCSAVTRMSMMIIRSMIGTIHLSPAFRTPAKRPSRPTTPCSYSLTIRKPERKKSRTSAAAMINPKGGMASLSFRGWLRLNRCDESLEGRHPHGGAGGDAGRAAGLPVLAVDEGLPRARPDLAQRAAAGAEEPGGSYLERPRPHGGDAPGDEAQHEGERDRDRPDDPRRQREGARIEPVLGRGPVHEEEHPEHHARGASHAGEPVGRDVGLRDEEPRPDEDERHGPRVHRDDLHRQEREQERDGAGEAGDDEPRVVELDGDPERADEHQDGGDVGVGQEGEEPLADGRLVRHERSPPGPELLPFPH